MKTIKWIFVLVLFLGVFSCKKKETTSVKVTVIDSDLNRAVPNWKVYLEEKHYNILRVSGSDAYNVIWEGYTDANGQKDFGEFDTYKSNHYVYAVRAKDMNTYTDIEKGTSNNITLKITEPFKLQRRFVPPPPYSGGDSMRLEFYEITNNMLRLVLTSSNYYPYEAGGLISGTYYYNIDKYKAGVYTNIKDTVFYDVNSSYEYDVNW